VRRNLGKKKPKKGACLCGRDLNSPSLLKRSGTEAEMSRKILVLLEQVLEEGKEPESLRVRKEKEDRVTGELSFSLFYLMGRE